MKSNQHTTYAMLKRIYTLIKSSKSRGVVLADIREQHEKVTSEMIYSILSTLTFLGLIKVQKTYKCVKRYYAVSEMKQ